MSGLPDGSIQATIAFALVLIFIIASLFLYNDLPDFTISLISGEERPQGRSRRTNLSLSRTSASSRSNCLRRWGRSQLPWRGFISGLDPSAQQARRCDATTTPSPPPFVSSPPRRPQVSLVSPAPRCRSASKQRLPTDGSCPASRGTMKACLSNLKPASSGIRGARLHVTPSSSGSNFPANPARVRSYPSRGKRRPNRRRRLP